MKFKLQKSVLSDSLQTIQNIVAAKTTLPILSNALMLAKDGSLTFTATNLDITISKTIGVEDLEDGATTLPAKKLYGLLQTLDTGDIEVRVDDKNHAHIDCGSSHFTLIGMPSGDFPTSVSADGGIKYTIDRGLFTEMLRMTQYAASTDDSRPALNGVLLNFSEGKLSCVATDGRRLALMEKEMEFPAENNRDVIIPSKAVNELLRIITGEGGMSICIKDKQAIFEFDDTVMSCKLIDGVYPNFRQVIPSDSEFRIGMPREEVLTILRRVMYFISERNSSMRLTFEDNNLEISAESPDVGEIKETIPVKYSGPQLSYTYNPEFMAEPLRNIKSDEVFIELNSGMSPSLIKGSPDLPFLYVLMPLR